MPHPKNLEIFAICCPRSTSLGVKLKNVFCDLVVCSGVKYNGSDNCLVSLLVKIFIPL